MKQFFQISLLTTIALAGCAHHPETRLEGYDFEGRLHAASAIGPMDSRDDAYSAIAIDATRANNVTVAVPAAKSIGDFDKRNRAAAECARWCNEQGLKESATKFAELIGDDDLRNNILKQVVSNR